MCSASHSVIVRIGATLPSAGKENHGVRITPPMICVASA
jgi:hypothetical protein